MLSIKIVSLSTFQFESLTFKSMKTSENGHSVTITVCLLKWKAHWPVTLVHTCWWSGWAWVHRHCGGICFSRLRPPTLLRQRHCPHPMRGHPQLLLPFQKHPGRNISRSGVQLPGLFLSVAYQHFSMEKCDHAKKMLTGNERRHVRQHVLGKDKYHQRKRQRKETSQTPKNQATYTA